MGPGKQVCMYVYIYIHACPSVRSIGVVLLWLCCMLMALNTRYA